MRLFMCMVLCLPIFLTGCSYFSKSPVMGRNKHYLCAYSVPPLRTLPGTRVDAFHNDYPIPDRCYPDCDKTVNILPPGIH